jgi:hypothetical protein
MTDFSTIPVRQNDQNITAAWFNTIRTKLVGFEDSPDLVVYVDDAAYVTAKGSAAELGDIYANSTLNAIRFYSGSEWVTVETQLNKVDATTAPTVNDDSTSGYSVGSFWHDVTNDLTYICIDATATAAVWKQIVDTDSVQDVVNKSLTDATTTFQDDGDTTKKMKLQLSEITTATTRTQSVQDVDDTFVYRASTDDLSNKTFTDELTLTQIATPAEPAAGDTAVYSKTDGKMYYYPNGGAETEIGAGGGAGAGLINFLSEKTITDYSAFDDGAVTVPIDGTGGAPTYISVSEETVSPIDTSDNILNVKISHAGGGSAQGEGVSVDFSTRGEVDYANSITIRARVKTSANYVDEDMGFFIYDVTNTKIIQTAQRDIYANSFPGEQIFEWQTSPDSTSYRLIAMQTSTQASAYDLTMTVEVGPDSETYAVPQVYLGDLSSTTTTNLTNTAWDYAKYWRNGEHLSGELRFYCSSTPAAFTTLDIGIPFTVAANTVTFRGSSYIEDAGTAGYHARPFYVGSDTLRIRVSAIITTYTQTIDCTSSIPMTWQAGDYITVTFEGLPIQGWDSNSTLANQYTNADLFAQATMSGAWTSTALTTYQKINFDTVVKDNSGMFNASTSEMEILESGDYLAEVGIIANTLADQKRAFIDVYVNAVRTKRLAGHLQGAALVSYITGSAIVPDLVKGDLVTLYLWQDDSASETFGSASSIDNHFSMKLLRPKSNSVFKSDKTFMRVSSNNGQTVTNGSKIIYEDIEDDTHGIYDNTTGIATISKGDFYAISSKSRETSGITVINSIFGGGTQIDLEMEPSEGGASPANTSCGCYTEVWLNKGDQVYIQNDTGASITLSTNSYENHFEIRGI